MVYLEHSANGPLGGPVIANDTDPAVGDPFDTVQGSPTYDDTYSVLGGRSIHIDALNGSSEYMRWNIGPFVQSAHRFFLYPETMPANAIFIIRNGGGGRVMSLVLNSSGNLTVQDVNGSLTPTLTPAISAQQWWRFEVTLDTATGAWSVDIYDGNSATPTVSGSGTATFTGGAEQVAVGKYTTSSNAALWFDEIVTETGTVTPIGPLPNALLDYTITGIYAPNTSTRTGWRIDASTSVGEVSISPEAGTTVTPTESSPGVFDVVDDGGSSNLQYLLTASVTGDNDTASVTIERSTVASAAPDVMLVLQAGDPADINNWK